MNVEQQEICKLAGWPAGKLFSGEIIKKTQGDDHG